MKNESSNTPAQYEEAVLPETADYVVTLVHGTWAQDSEWPDKDGPIARRLREALDGHVVVNRFGWTGGNSYRARQEAGKDLQRQLFKDVRQHRDAHHFIIAHSHGGNVALYALNDSLLAKSVSGLVTLATPFLNCEPKNPWILFQLCIYGATFGLAFAVLSYVVLPLVLRGIEYSHTFPGWAEVGVYLGMLWIGYAIGSIVWESLQGFGELLTDWLIDASSDVQTVLLSMLSISHCSKMHLLAMRFRGDEARWYLALLTLFALPFPLLLKISGYLFLVVYAFALFMVAADVIAEFARALVGVSIPYAPWVFTTNIYYLSVAVLVVTLLGAIVLPKLIRGHKFGYGKEVLLTPVLVNITVTDLPKSFPNAIAKYYKLTTALRSMIAVHGLRSIVKPSLIHSWLYQHGPAIEDIILWIQQTAVNTRKDQCTTR